MSEVKIVTHSVYVPPNTDMEAMGGAYRALFSSLGVQNTDIIPFPENTTGVSHPIEECLKKMTSEFMGTMGIVQGLVLEHGTLNFENMTFNGQTATFSFNYTE